MASWLGVWRGIIRLRLLRERQRDVSLKDVSLKDVSLDMTHAIISQTKLINISMDVILNM